MKEIELTKGKVAIVDDEDFEFLSQWKWRYMDSGYASRTSSLVEGNGKRRSVCMHKFLMLGLDFDRKKIVDHCNRNKLDNRRSNLRIGNQSLNQANKKSVPNSSSIYKGVVKRKDKFVMQLYQNGRKIFDKTFTNEIACANYYNHKAKEVYGEFALLNEVEYMSLEECEKYFSKRHKGNYVGVSKTANGKWKSNIRITDNYIHLGTFTTESEAVKARNAKAIELNKLHLVQEIKGES